jgi:hypothetical protein
MHSGGTCEHYLKWFNSSLDIGGGGSGGGGGRGASGSVHIVFYDRSPAAGVAGCNSYFAHIVSITLSISCLSASVFVGFRLCPAGMDIRRPSRWRGSAVSEYSGGRPPG